MPNDVKEKSRAHPIPLTSQWVKASVNLVKLQYMQCALRVSDTTHLIMRVEGCSHGNVEAVGIPGSGATWHYVRRALECLDGCSLSATPLQT